jgi:hypothetical protein
MLLELQLPGNIEGLYDMQGLDWPGNAVVGEKFVFYPERFVADDECPALAPQTYKIVAIKP